MAEDTQMNTADSVWSRYVYMRDHHLRYMAKASKADDFFIGMQWAEEDLALLKAQRRPALTINMILSTISNVLGEQIFNRSDISFRPRNSSATDEVADALTKVFRQIDDNNQMEWVRSDVFADGVIGSRGYFDVRLSFEDNQLGEVSISRLNPANVLLDPDADEYDPEKWSDVLISRWLTVDEIELLYSKADADALRGDPGVDPLYAYDALDSERARFGEDEEVYYGYNSLEEDENTRRIRVLERQWRKLDRFDHFVDTMNGDVRPVPHHWNPETVKEYLEANPSIVVDKRLGRRIRWTVVAGNRVLHDDWSPYNCFTVVPYFPYLRQGRTVGLVENLIDPQELLNKVSSQELHVVNTTANSGYILQTDNLVGMTPAELEARGSQTGLVLQVRNMDGISKIQPNQVPSGLDRISYKAEDHIKSISGVTDYMKGNPREDVAARAVTENKASGQVNLAKAMDNLRRTDYILARNVLTMVQTYYTEERLVRITADTVTGDVESLVVNEVTPEGEILLDLTIGEYAVVVTTQPERETFEDSQFDQAVALRRDLGIAIPDKFIIQTSRLRDKADIVAAMEGDQNSEEAQAQRAYQQQVNQLDLEEKASTIEDRRADVALKQAKAQKTAAEGNEEGDALTLEMRKLELEHELAMEKMRGELGIAREKMEGELAIARQKAAEEAQIKRQAQQQAAMDKRVQTAQSAAQPQE